VAERPYHSYPKHSPVHELGTVKHSNPHKPRAIYSLTIADLHLAAAHKTTHNGRVVTPARRNKGEVAVGVEETPAHMTVDAA